jgi:hypothetical protein
MGLLASAIVFVELGGIANAAPLRPAGRHAQGDVG